MSVTVEDDMYILSNSTYRKSKWCVMQGGRWNPSRRIWNFDISKFETPRELESLYENAPDNDMINQANQSRSQMDRIIINRSKNLKKQNGKMADEKLKEWQTTLVPTEEIVEHEEFVAGDGLKFIGYKTGPDLDKLMSYKGFEHCHVFKKKFSNGGGIIVYSGTEDED